MGFNLFALILIIYPYIFLVSHFAYQIMPFDKNPFLIIITFSCILIWITSIKKHFTELIAFSILAASFLAVMLTRQAVYGEPFDVFPVRSSLLIIIFMSIPTLVVAKTEQVNSLKKIIQVNSIIQAALGVIHYYFLPFIITGTEEISRTGRLFAIDYSHPIFTRENGILGNASIYANVLLVGLFLVVNEKKRGIQLLAQWAAVFILLWGTILSGSRLPALVASTLAAYFFIKNSSFVAVGFAAIISAITLKFASERILYLLSRFSSEGNEIRQEKNALGWEMYTSDPIHAFIGAPRALLASGKTISGYYFSDNTFIYYLLTSGLIFSSIWFCYFIYQCTKKYKSPQAWVLLAYFFGCIWFTNGVLWDLWVLYLFSSLFVLSKSTRSQHKMLTFLISIGNKTVLQTKKQFRGSEGQCYDRK